jgi:thiamine biosynthesis lipoprotein
MGCAAAVTVVGADGLALAAEQMLFDLEQRWSRFLPQSDISRLNAAGGQWEKVDRRTIDLIGAMRQGWTATGGGFDPTLLAPLVGLGMSASWHDPGAVTVLPVGVSLRGDPARIEVDVERSAVRLPPGTVLDAGGIGKGLAADLVVADLLAAGAAGALVDVGGDLCVRGTPPDDHGWQIAVHDPVRDVEVARLALVHGGVATSGVTERTWTAPSGEPVHHLLDPEHARPVPIGAAHLRSATVVAGTAAWAEVWTKALFVHGPQRVLPRLDELGLGGFVVYGDGSREANVAWSSFATEVPA